MNTKRLNEIIAASCFKNLPTVDRTGIEYVPLKHAVRDFKRYIKQEDVLNIQIDENGYVSLWKSENKEIFETLKKIHFFDFHTTNNGKIVGLHQVVQYCSIGWRLFLRGYSCEQGTAEVHHLDGDPTNNKAGNLRYISPALNKGLSSITRSLNSSRVKNPVSESFSAAANMAHLTWKRISRRLGLKCKLPDIQAFLLKLPRNMRTEIVRFWQAPEELIRALPEEFVNRAAFSL